MAEHILETRIQLRYGTYDEWSGSSVILKKGEAAICTFPNNTTENLSDSTSNYIPSAVGIKIGDNYHTFQELPWVQAVAADVYNWAKSSTKPTYTADEINGLAQYIEQHSSGGSGSGVSTSYRIIYDNTNNKYILQYYDDITQDWENTTSEIDFSTVLNRLKAIENWANGSQIDIGSITTPLVSYISDAVGVAVGRLDVNDTAIEHQFVTKVSEENGKISVQRSTIDASDISTGVLLTEQGGTGFSSVNSNEILIGSETGQLQKANISTTINNDNINDIPTSGAVASYVAQETMGITGAMHFIGEATVVITDNSRIDPQITMGNGARYNFRMARAGDVILYDAKEFVWTGFYWRLLGDEGSYAIKGSITNADIAGDANISIDKIANLQSSLDNKVTVQEGKGLSSNDYINEDKLKLQSIEDNAQANTIEHIFLNEREIIPSVIEGLAKSINLSFLTLTQEQIDKLDGIESNAQKNLIEHIFLNGEELRPTVIETIANSINLAINEFDSASREKLSNIETEAQVNKIEKIIYDGEELIPNDSKVVTINSDPHTEHENVIESIVINNQEQPIVNKQVNITIDQEALNLNVVAGAEIPKENNSGKDEVEQIQKKLQFQRVAVTGNVKDLLQTNDEYITLFCGSSTEVV